nr:hypothetical protein BaRGS_025915 [Batillaria attramentaria]
MLKPFDHDKQAVHSISQDTFHTKYLKPLLKDEGHVIVAFLQDKLHINDISKYADVYNPSSDGGAFKNIKGLLDEHFSLELPHVLDSHQALSSLRSKFPGTVHDVDPATDLSSLDLGGKQNYLLIVRLAPVASAKNEEAAITANDNLVGKVADHLQKRSVRYTALYTAEASESTEEGGHFARRLMADVPDVDTKGIFFNASYSNGSAYAYLTSISFCLLTMKLDDCTGWFTTAIWMGIIPVALNIIVLLLGMYMIASLSTNDRFDDPKGKTLTINAGE